MEQSLKVNILVWVLTNYVGICVKNSWKNICSLRLSDKLFTHDVTYFLLSELNQLTVVVEEVYYTPRICVLYILMLQIIQLLVNKLAGIFIVIFQPKDTQKHYCIVAYVRFLVIFYIKPVTKTVDIEKQSIDSETPICSNDYFLTLHSSF